jgi:hypothetical protein
MPIAISSRTVALLDSWLTGYPTNCFAEFDLHFIDNWPVLLEQQQHNPGALQADARSYMQSTQLHIPVSATHWAKRTAIVVNRSKTDFSWKLPEFSRITKFSSSAQFKEGQLPLDMAVCKNTNGLGNFACNILGIDALLCKQHASGNVYVLWAILTLKLLLYPAGFAATQCMHLK